MSRAPILRCSALICVPLLATAQSARRPITQDDYDRWRSVQGATLSSDGQWAAWTESPQVGDGDLVVRSTRGGTPFRVSRGYTGRPIISFASDSPFVAPPPQFMPDGSLLAALAYAPVDSFERARRNRPRALPAPRTRLLLVRTGATPTSSMVPRVRSVRMPRDGGRWFAYQLEADSTPRADAPPRDSAARRDSTARRLAPREYGSTLVLRSADLATEQRISDVSSYALDPSGMWVAYTVTARTPGRDGAYLRQLGGTTDIELARGTADYKAITFDRDGKQVAFVSNRDEFGARDTARFAIYRAAVGASASATRVAAADDFGQGLRISDRQLSFTRDGSALVFGVGRPPVDTLSTDSLADKAIVDVWHWQDARLQPQQKLEVGRDRDRTWTAVARVGARPVKRLIGNDTLTQVTVSNDGLTALAITQLPYAVQAMWNGGNADVHVIDIVTGARKRIAERVEFGAQLSPGGRYVTWFDKGAWSAYDTRTGRTATLTTPTSGVRFDQETWDTPSTPAPWGIAGWTKDDATLLLNSRFDVWEIDPSGTRPPRVMTDSAGVRANTVLRLVNLDPTTPWVDATQPVYLSAFNERTKQSGWWRDRLGTTTPAEVLLMEDARWQLLGKARGADQFLVTRQTYTEFPNLRTGTSLTQTTPISDANPQQSEVRWGSVELVEWRSTDGRPLQGLLYKPEGFDATRQYPMVTYFYEQLSDGLHQYNAPSGRNVVNPTVYASQGYLVFFPDIAYEDGYPGPSALKSIVPGIQSLIARGFVDPKRIGTSGQSWGGYQTAYMITQTNLFAAAFAGAPVANMTSAYGGIRWESGFARPFQYERTQSRIGGSLWQYPLRFIENSPLFQADRIQTPVLIMANDADGAVPWYQGIEMFIALRRLGKEAYLVNYNGDGHNPRKRANQKDIDRRMLQFFGHHLKGEPMPDWMREGIPYLQKGRDQFPRPVTAAAGGTGR
jgi:dipeptidyl aminopeptidase/acylaminoacyl peptidase